MQNISEHLQEVIPHEGKLKFIDEVWRTLALSYGVKNLNDILHIAGSTAKVLRGIIDKEPGDFDLTTTDTAFFRYVQKFAAKIFLHYKVTVLNNRVIINNGFFEIEIWYDKFNLPVIEKDNLKIQIYE